MEPSRACRGEGGFVAAQTEAPLILKTQSLNGKLHRRCGWGHKRAQSVG